jgi:hypothetical protein
MKITKMVFTRISLKVCSAAHASAIDVLPGDNTGIREVISACVRNFLKHCSQVRGLLVIVQVRCSPAAIVPLQLPVNDLLNKVPVDIISVTLNV